MRIPLSSYGTVEKSFTNMLEKRRDLLVSRHEEENVLHIVAVMNSKTVACDPSIDMDAVKLIGEKVMETAQLIKNQDS